jgi:hypothetical protein
MPLDSELVAETRAWLAKGGMDLEAAALDLTARTPLTADVVFHWQARPGLPGRPAPAARPRRGAASAVPVA